MHNVLSVPSVLYVLSSFLLLAPPLEAVDEPSEAEARAALRKAVAFFHHEVSIEGGYLWRYTSDLALREGENKAHADTAWVQPPGTPSVGEAYLRAYARTGEQSCLDAAAATGYALAKGQLRSGGWDYRIEFDPERRQRYAYRIPPHNPDGRNTTTLDDDTTQAALRFLMRLDEALGFDDADIHTCAATALEALLAAQYPNGAWPQRFDAPPNPEDYPVMRANYPKDWPRTFPNENYRGYYTFNDNTLADVIDTLFLAEEVYGGGQYAAAAKRGGDFILLAQMPEPQPAWAQQYNAEMQPAWARKFEPPAITGSESQGILETLLMLHRRTGDEKYLDAVEPALEYLKRSLRPDGRLARFYELKTNQPLYFTLDYELTYSDESTPTHYAFIVGSRLEAIEREYEREREGRTAQTPRPPGPETLARRARDVIDTLDARGAWTESGSMREYPDAGVNEVISCRTFINRLDALSQYIAALE